jgi:hypothetical protein
MDDLKEQLGDMFGVDAEAPPAVEDAAPPAAPVETPASPPEQQQPQEPPASPVEEPKQAHEVPLVALLNEREKRQNAEREAAELRAWKAEQEAKAAPIQRPDPYEDPDGYNQYVQNQLAASEWKTRAEISGRFAEQRHGKELVEAAVAWAQAEGAKDPTLGQRVMAQASPVEWVVDQYNRDQIYQRISSDPNAYAQFQANPGAVAPPPMMAPAVAPKQAPPRSLATAPSTGAGHQVVPDGSALDSLKFNLG